MGLFLSSGGSSLASDSVELSREGTGEPVLGVLLLLELKPDSGPLEDAPGEQSGKGETGIFSGPVDCSTETDKELIVG